MFLKQRSEHPLPPNSICQKPHTYISIVSQLIQMFMQYKLTIIIFVFRCAVKYSKVHISTEVHLTSVSWSTGMDYHTICISN